MCYHHELLRRVEGETTLCATFYASWVRRSLMIVSVFLTASQAYATERMVDLELVLAADISDSIDEEEAILQRRGFANAIRDPHVIAMIQSGSLGRIAVTYMEWSGVHIQNTLVDWTEISGADSARAVANAIDQPGARIEEWIQYTSISTLIVHALHSLNGNRFQGRRQIIDISGDGPNNRGAYVNLARDLAIADGITINGLPIINDRPDRYGYPPMPGLDLYYEDCVIGGMGAFIVVADGFQDFARAIRHKILLEVAGKWPLETIFRHASSRARPPCNAGELELPPDWMFDFN